MCKIMGKGKIKSLCTQSGKEGGGGLTTTSLIMSLCGKPFCDGMPKNTYNKYKQSQSKRGLE